MKCYEVTGFVLEQDAFCIDCAYGKVKKHGFPVFACSEDGFDCTRCGEHFGAEETEETNESDEDSETEEE
jgi:hypothetical protein